jgi:hypothetical protein
VQGFLQAGIGVLHGQGQFIFADIFDRSRFD